jgi:dTDP-4-dehydrorhamnose 3,5-epimerase-like enzyme
MTDATPKVRFAELKNHGDARGFSFTAPPEALEYVGRAADVHLASTAPRAVRGNHYHRKGRMAIVVLPGSRWSFHWDEGEGTKSQHRVFNGSGAILILVAPGASHAIRNDGDSMLWMTAISSEAYDAADRVARNVL